MSTHNREQKLAYGRVVDAVRERLAGILPREELDNPGAESKRALRPIAAEEIKRFNRLAKSAKQPTLEGSADKLTARILRDLLGLGPLDALLAHEAIEDIYILGPHKVMVVTSDGTRKTVGLDFGSEDRLMALARRALAQDGKRVDFLHPFADARLRDGSRLHISIHPCADPSPQIVIRRHRQIFDPGDDRLGRLKDLGTLSQGAVDLLRDAIRCGVSVLVAGATAAGKTTLINALGGEMDLQAPVVCIEDVRELDFPGINVSYVVTRLPSPEGQGGITQRYLVQQALRKRAEWIVLGEARGDEAWDFAQAGNTGHAVLGSVHANSATDAIERYRDLCMQSAENLRETVALRVVARAFRLVVFLQHDPQLRRRVVTHIAEVTGDLLEGAPVLRYLFSSEEGQLLSGPDAPSELLERMLKRAGERSSAVPSDDGDS